MEREFGRGETDFFGVEGRDVEDDWLFDEVDFAARETFAFADEADGAEGRLGEVEVETFSGGVLAAAFAAALWSWDFMDDGVGIDIGVSPVGFLLLTNAALGGHAESF